MFVARAHLRLAVAEWARAVHARALEFGESVGASVPAKGHVLVRAATCAKLQFKLATHLGLRVLFGC